MSEPKDVVCPACHERADGEAEVKDPVRRVAVRCRYFARLRYPDLTVAWCPACAVQHNECCLCGKPLPKQ